MTWPLDFTCAPQPNDAKTRLRPAILRGRERRLSKQTRPVTSIEVYAVTRLDVTTMASRQRFVTISLPRVRFLERP